MRYAGIIKNDLSAAPGVCLSVFTQGCPNHCPGCHNRDTWAFNGGYEFTNDTLDEILIGLKANGIDRTLCIMGGEPLCEENTFLTILIINAVKDMYPETPIYIWSGYTIEELLARKNERINTILKNSDVLVDGRYIQELRDISLKMRGSSNQRIINLREIDIE